MVHSQVNLFLLEGVAEALGDVGHEIGVVVEGRHEGVGALVQLVPQTHRLHRVHLLFGGFECHWLLVALVILVTV